MNQASVFIIFIPFLTTALIYRMYKIIPAVILMVVINNTPFVFTWTNSNLVLSITH